jgi:toxin ParE2
MKPFRLLRVAERELQEAAEFYHHQSPSLGDRLIRDFLTLVERLGYFPESGPKLSRRLRVARLKDFPYNIVYQIEPYSIVVVAVAHQSRKPGYWKGRI